MIEELSRFATRKAAIDAPGWVPSQCIEPESIESLSSVLSEASRSQTSILVIGGGTRVGWANVSSEIQLGVSTLGLAGVDVFDPDEGVLHVRAGTRLQDVQAIAADKGWELPVDAPGSTSTVGGVIASAATGPRAQVFGRVADAILGLEVVGADGVATKCGGRVVKNVTGYDLAKLYCGSFGTLGVLTGAWLRLRPLPKQRLALCAPLPTDPVGFEMSRKLARLTSIRALVWIEGENSDADEGVYFELGGGEAELGHDRAAIESCLSTREIGTERIDSLRDARASAQGAPIAFRVRVLGSDCKSLVRQIRDAGLVVAVDLGLGVVHARGSLDSMDQLLFLRDAAIDRGGFVTFEQIPDSWRAGIDVLGASDESSVLAAEIKHRFDPSNILNPGRFQIARRDQDER